MSEAASLRADLDRASAARDTARLKFFQARGRAARADAAEAAFMRQYVKQNASHQKRLGEMMAESAAAKGAVASATAELSRLEAIQAGLRAQFNARCDPRKDSVELDDAIPLLLLPVRLETRFAPTTAPASAKRELWVRVYPDDCLIDTFEEILSEDEVQCAQRYWTARWKAGKKEAQHRGAWRALVASVGSGRARWIVEHYAPLNPADEPVKANDFDIVLVVPTDEPLAAADGNAVLAYWIASWQADGKLAGETAAGAALEGAVGAQNAATWRDTYRPVNFDDVPAPPKTKTNVAVKAAFVVFPKPADTPTTPHSWSRPALVNLLPDRFVFIGYNAGKPPYEKVGMPIPSPLVAGPDPGAVGNEQLQQAGAELVVPEAMKWMVDFDRAVDCGMGFKIDLAQAGAEQGFERIVVLGLRLCPDPLRSRDDLGTLLQHHRDGAKGFSLVPQGTPTNNTEEHGSGYTGTEDADASFDEYFHAPAPLQFKEDWWTRNDGEWLAASLGIDLALLDSVLHSRGADQAEAQAMNVALWPATIGYMLETMMHPMFGDAEVEAVRWFFTHFVSGRGMVPAIRIGRQPYGILPTAAFSRLRWPSESRSSAGVGRVLEPIYEALRTASQDWSAMALDTARVGKAGDPHQILLDVVGLHPASVEFYHRYGQSLEDLFNRWNLWGAGAQVAGSIVVAEHLAAGMALLRALGAKPDAPEPDVLRRFFLDGANPLNGPVIDDRPLSEKDPVRAYTTDNKNYLVWLHEAAETSLERLRKEEGFTSDTPPKALLYLLARHALLEAFWDASLRLQRDRGVLDDPTVHRFRREQPFIHVAADGSPSGSRWAPLYKADAIVTGSAEQLIGNYIPTIIGQESAADRLAAMIEALRRLEGVPTARLERAFAEHIDCCSYRVDACQQGLIQVALARMRFGRDAQGNLAVTPGIHLGAYGWLEDVRPRDRQLTPVSLDPARASAFASASGEPLVHDDTNGGYIHAPSLNHAVTAAVLRNGYLSNASATNPQTLAVNLSSRRVRIAMSVLEGIREGQSLSALLGYQIERGLHDAHNLAEVDKFIYGLRKKFSLASDLIADTKTADDVPIEAVEARNVMDGMALVDHVKKTGSAHYPFGLDLPAATAAEAVAIDAELDRIVDTYDAIADVALAESVYQAVQGNYDRVASVLDMTGKGQLPPELGVVSTPRSGRTVTHRVALHLRAGLDETQSAFAFAVTPRSRAEPAVNAWLGTIFPDPGAVGCTVSYFDPLTSSLRETVVTQADLGLQPLDLLYIGAIDGQQAMTELDDRVLLHVHKKFKPRPDSQVSLSYTTRPAGKFGFFEVAPLVRSLRVLMLHSRALRASDAALQGEAKNAEEPAIYVKADRVREVWKQLNAVRTDIAKFHQDLKALHDNENANRATILDDIDKNVDQFVELLERASRFGVPQTGWGFALDWKRATFASVLGQLGGLVERWTVKLADYDAQIRRYASLPAATGAAERFLLLASAERFIRATAANPPPATPALYKSALDTKRSEFAARLTTLRGGLNPATTSIATLRKNVAALLQGPPPASQFELQKTDTAEIETSIIAFSAEMMTRAASLAARIQKAQLDRADARLKEHDLAADRGNTRARLLESAAKLLLGEDIVLVPEFKPGERHATELRRAYDATAAGTLLKYQTETRMQRFPVDRWLYGLARVRGKLRHWERAMMLAGGFARMEPQLTPMQLPYKENDSWLGLEYPADYDFDGERLLYTACVPQAFDPAARQCGLLLDEWSEVLPGADETTGIAFHFDRPNAEPPQAFLLITPTEFTGAWKWRDASDAVFETLDQAKMRTVEPAQIDATDYAKFLPGVAVMTTLYQVSIMTNLARNNDVHIAVEAMANG